MKKILALSIVLWGVLYFVSPILIKQYQKKSYVSYINQIAIPVMAKSDTKKFDNPEMAYLMDYIQTFDPKTKTLPKERLFSTLKTINKNPSARSVDDLEWKNIPSDMSGRIRDITFDPSDPDNKKVWACAATGGLWYNNDIYNPNTSWQSVSDIWPALSVSKIAFDPQDPSIIYVGTGESYTAVTIYRESSGVGNGIWKSTDGGISWEVMPSTSSFSYINDIVVRVENGISILYTAVVSGHYKGATFGSNTSNGLYRSIDAGITWSQVLPNMKDKDHSYAVSDIELSGEKLFVGTMRNNDEEGAGIIFSSSDGLKWVIYSEMADTKFYPEQGLYAGRVIIKAAPSNPDKIYALISGGIKFTSGFIRDHGDRTLLIQSKDQGETWRTLPKPPTDNWGTWSNITWHAAAMAVDPNNEDNLVLGALNGYLLRIEENFFLKSKFDWDIISYWYELGGHPELVHADHHDILFKPGSSDEVFFSTDGGVFYSSNFTSSKNENFVSASNVFPHFEDRNKGLNTLQFYTTAISPDESKDLVMGGLQDNGTVKYSRKQPITVSDRIFGGDGAYCFYDSEDPFIEITCSQHNYWGAIFDEEYDAINSDFQYVSGLFINPAVYNPKTNKIIANGMGLGGAIPSTDNLHQDEISIMEVVSRKAIGAGTGGYFLSKFTKLNTGSLLPYTSMKLSPFSPESNSNILIGTLDGRVFFVENVESSPVSVEIGSDDFPIGNISSVAFGKNENEAIVTFSNYGVSSIWHTIDKGTNWQEIEGDLPDMPVRWVEYHPTDVNTAYIATEIGVWYTEDLGKSEIFWTKSTGLPNVRVDMLQIRPSDGKIVAATHGRGLFEGKLKLSEIIIAASPDIIKPQISIYPNPTSHTLRIGNSQQINGATIYDINGTLISKTILAQNEVDVSFLKKGLYIVEFTSKGIPYKKKFVKN